MEEIVQKNGRALNVAKIFAILWKKRKFFFIIPPLVFILTYLFYCQLPVYYKCELELAPESSKQANLGSLGSLASSLGFSQLSNLTQGNDAITPMLYPDLFKSEQFLLTLFPTEIETIDGEIKTTYYDYLCHYQKSSLLSSILSVFQSHEDKIEEPMSSEISDSFNLTKRQQIAIKAISAKISCNIDKKTNAVSIETRDQDPKVCAIIGNEVLARMQDFIVDYRTKKARIDYEYYQKLAAEAKEEYDKATKDYATYTDSHRSVITQEVTTEKDRLRNRLQLTYQLYTSQELMRQSAEAKIQENKPAFTIIRSAVVPYKPAGPRKMRNSVVVTFLSVIVLCVFFICKEIEKREEETIFFGN